MDLADAIDNFVWNVGDFRQVTAWLLHNKT